MFKYTLLAITALVSLTNAADVQVSSTENLGDLSHCIEDLEECVDTAKAAVAAFKTEDYLNTIENLYGLYEYVKKVEISCANITASDTKPAV